MLTRVLEMFMRVSVLASVVVRVVAMVVRVRVRRLVYGGGGREVVDELDGAHGCAGVGVENRLLESFLHSLGDDKQPARSGRTEAHWPDKQKYKRHSAYCTW